jgi:hypothetical protein
MRTILLLIATAVLTALTAPAADAASFKLLDPGNPQMVAGVYNDLRGHQDGGGALALITQKSGAIDWTPLVIGGTLGQGLGGPSVALGTTANLLPDVKAGLLAGVRALWPDPVKFANIKAVLAPPAPGTPDAVMSIGPNVSYVFYDGLKGRLTFTLFVGAAWKF